MVLVKFKRRKNRSKLFLNPIFELKKLPHIFKYAEPFKPLYPTDLHFKTEEDLEFFEAPKMAQAALRAHNEKRLMHEKCPPLTYSRELAKHAKSWAENIVNFQFVRPRPYNKYGENIAFVSSHTRYITHEEAVTRAVQYWYDKGKNYKRYGKEPTSQKQAGETGPFTQVVWQATRCIGAATVRLSKGNVLVVCNYYPRGNTFRHFGLNVRPRQKRVTWSDDNVENEELFSKRTSLQEPRFENKLFKAFDLI